MQKCTYENTMNAIKLLKSINLNAIIICFVTTLESHQFSEC